MDLEKTQRTVWEVSDRVAFFENMKPMLNISKEEAEEIMEQLQERDFDYLEVAAYLPDSKSDDPAAVLVFDGKIDVYWDIFDPSQMEKVLQKVRQLAGQGPQLTYTRGLTQRDWRKRFQALSPL